MEIFGDLSYLTPTYIATQLALGAVLGLLLGATAIGAGVLVLPALMVVSGIEPAAAVGTSLLFGLLSKAFGVFKHWQLGMVAGQTAKFFSIGAVPMVLIVSFGINHLQKFMPAESYETGMKLFIIGMIFIVCLYLMWDAFRKNSTPQEPRCDELLDGGEKKRAVLYGGAIGAIAGGTSIGGGVILIPILNHIFKLSAQCIVGSSLMISIGLSIVGSGVYLMYGNINVPVALLLVIGSLPGVKIGVKMASNLSDKNLKKLIAFVAVFSFISMVAGFAR